MRLRNSFIMLVLLCLAVEVGFTYESYESEATPAVVNPVIASPLRETISLDGDWNFAIDPQNKGQNWIKKWFSPEHAMPDQLPIKVPGCWETQGIGGPGMSNPVSVETAFRQLRNAYTGTGWYKKRIMIPENWAGKHIWLKVGGVNAQGWFWVNGTYLMHLANYCGTYKYDITDMVTPGSEAVIAAKVRNDVPSGKGLFNWIRRFGGLHRSVEIDATNNIFIDYAYVDGDLDNKKATVRVKLRSMKTADTASTSCQIQVVASTLSGEKAGQATSTVSLKENETVDISIEVPLEPFNTWSPESPNLYKMEIILVDVY